MRIKGAIFDMDGLLLDTEAQDVYKRQYPSFIAPPS